MCANPRLVFKWVKIPHLLCPSNHDEGTSRSPGPLLITPAANLVEELHRDVFQIVDLVIIQPIHHRGITTSNKHGFSMGIKVKRGQLPQSISSRLSTAWIISFSRFHLGKNRVSRSHLFFTKIAMHNINMTYIKKNKISLFSCFLLLFFGEADWRRWWKVNNESNRHVGKPQYNPPCQDDEPCSASGKLSWLFWYQRPSKHQASRRHLVGDWHVSKKKGNKHERSMQAEKGWNLAYAVIAFGVWRVFLRLLSVVGGTWGVRVVSGTWGVRVGLVALGDFLPNHLAESTVLVLQPKKRKICENSEN
jgi:hypothetical protein